MFLRPPKDKGISHVDTLSTWEGIYHCIYDEKMMLVIVKIDHILPSCEMLGMRFCAEEGFAETRIADYAKQAISQQAVSDFTSYAERTAIALKRTAKLDDPFFGGDDDDTATATRRVLPRKKQARRQTAD